MQSSYPARRRLVLALLLMMATASAMQAPAPAPQNYERALPLRRFPNSRTTQTDKQGFYFMPTAIGDDYFDGTSPPERVRRHFEIARDLGAKYLRCAFSWNAIEPQQGRYQWKFWDDLVAAAHDSGIALIPYVAYTPEWAATQHDAFWAQPPHEPRLFAEFMATLALRYRGKVASWELWNEPDNKDYWRGTAEQFAEMIREAAVAVRKADPDAVLILGGITRVDQSFFDALIFRDHLDRSVDVVAMHDYAESWVAQTAETLLDSWLPAVAQEVADDRSGDDLWLNEMGYADYRYRSNLASAYGVPAYFAYEHTGAYQAEYLFKSEVMALASGEVSLTGWYRIDDFPPTEKRLGPDLVNHHLGLVDVRGQPKPAYFALRFFNRLFDQPTRTFERRTPHIKGSHALVSVIERKDGTYVIAAWLASPTGPEVPDRSGEAVDSRHELISITMPCPVSHLAAYDVEGHLVSTPARIHNGVQRMELSGGDVTIEEIHCQPRRRPAAASNPPD